MRSLYDVSALIALLDENHPAHDAVYQWFNHNIEQGWASCPLTQNGCLRILSQPSYPRPLSITESYERLRVAMSTPYHQFIADDISLFDDTLVRYNDLHSYQQITDVYLLALAVAHGARLVTLDTHISLGGVHGATEDHLVVI